uniref:Uncharacterized protein n=1 Tax=Strigamia maritima TaxID=126957 RepID=T1J5C9_STRMM
MADQLVHFSLSLPLMLWNVSAILSLVSPLGFQLCKDIMEDTEAAINNPLKRVLFACRKLPTCFPAFERTSRTPD